MVRRSFWIDLVESAWKEKPVVWLAGARRAGKTFLSRSLNKVEYFDCELPRTRRLMEDPEGFLKDLAGRRIVLDEIHRLSNPSELLKIAADHFLKTHIFAAGSSTLGASARFKDTLAGRKRDLWPAPMNSRDLVDFKNVDLSYRFLYDGLPPGPETTSRTGLESRGKVRLSTVINADKIVVLDDGRIVSTGNHQELYSSCELYRHLYDLQFKV